MWLSWKAPLIWAVGLIALVFSVVCLDNQLPDCNARRAVTHLLNQSKLLLVSTLDGRLTALDLDAKGAVKWSFLTTDKGLFSSTISNYQLLNKGYPLRIIPSLDGSIYRLNERSGTLEPLPLSADTLLKSTYKLGDDLMISGGKESRTFGVDVRTGELQYECGFDGCHSAKENDSATVLVIKRDKYVVRGVEPKSGVERWNFSVGENHLGLVPGDSSCGSSTDSIDVDDDFLLSDIKFLAPEGIINVSSDLPGDDQWSHSLESPIVNAWIFRGGNLEAVDLFDATYFSAGQSIPIAGKPILYIGYHQNQYYIHHSDFVRRNLEYGHEAIGHIVVPQLEWTQIEPSTAPESHSVSVAPQHDLFTHGQYIFNTESPQCSPDANHSYLDSTDNDTLVYMTGSIDEVIIVSLWHWWKQILGISLILAVVLNIAISLLKRRFRKVAAEICAVDHSNDLKLESSVKEASSAVSTSNDTGFTATNGSSSVSRQSSDTGFVSRFLTDFEPIRRLGKGGYGVVFEARNKIDTCHYAIKRIILPSRLEAREKVMREVKALAKLDHKGIVRFYNSWLEIPPSDMDEAGFKEWEDSEMSWASPRSDSIFSTNKLIVTESGFRQGGDTFGDTFSLPTSKRKPSEGVTDSYIVFQRSEANAESTSGSSTKSKPERPNVLVKNPRLYLFIQMQLCQKDTLREWLRNNLERDMPVLLDLFVQIVNAVEHVHAKGLMHRDLKPSNIFFSLDGCIKIGDFGLVTCATVDDFFHTPEIEKCDAFAELLSETDGKHTDKVGTRLYMSPEQIIGESYSNKVDIFSLGVIFFEMLVPFRTEMERISILSRVRQQFIPSEFETKYSEECKFLRKLLSYDPFERPSAEEILQNHLFKAADEEYHKADLSRRRRNLSFRESDS